MLSVPPFQAWPAILKATPALSVGICIFSFLFFWIYPSDSTALLLVPTAPLDFNLNAISFYIFPHVNIVHLVLNLVSLFPLLLRFEKTHGTVYTGITLNLLAVVTALAYCLVGLVLFPYDAVAGLLGIVFSFLAYYCYKEHIQRPVLHTFKVGGTEIPIPTLYFPFLNLFIIALIIPSTSFFGHLAGLGAGYLLAMDYLKVLYPPSKVVLFIEKHLAPGIAQLKKIVDFVSEEDAVNERGVSYRPILVRDIELVGAEPQLYEPFERRLGA